MATDWTGVGRGRVEGSTLGSAVVVVVSVDAARTKPMPVLVVSERGGCMSSKDAMVVKAACLSWDLM